MSGEIHTVGAGSVRLRADGVLHFVAAEGTRLDGPLSEELFTLYEQIGGGQALRVLSDIRGLAGSDAASREVGSSDRATSLHIAAAVIVGSRVTRMIGNLFLTLSRPAFPTRLFSDEEAALSWLLSVPAEAPPEAA